MNKTKHTSTIFRISGNGNSTLLVTQAKNLNHLCPLPSPLHLTHQNIMSAPPSKQLRIQSLSPIPLLLPWAHHPYSWNSLYQQPRHWPPSFPGPRTVCSPQTGQNKPLKYKSQQIIYPSSPFRFLTKCHLNSDFFPDQCIFWKSRFCLHTLSSFPCLYHFSQYEMLLINLCIVYFSSIDVNFLKARCSVLFAAIFPTPRKVT